ncbi:MAG: hypothetical protein IK111_03015 [Lachnospiraceae bacterium]|nr:hypothetical protein [Lachnospiraceae bacterium]
MASNEQERNEKLGQAVVGISWFIFAAKFIVIATVIALIVLYYIGRPLWIAPIIAIGAFAVYRLFLRLIWKLVDWASRQK